MFTATVNHKRSSPQTACEDFLARRFPLRCTGRSWSLLKVPRRSIFTAFHGGSCIMEIHGKQSPLTQRRCTRKRKRRNLPFVLTEPMNRSSPPPPASPPPRAGGVARRGRGGARATTSTPHH